jgi:hypothetical protein
MHREVVLSLKNSTKGDIAALPSWFSSNVTKVMDAFALLSNELEKVAALIAMSFQDANLCFANPIAGPWDQQESKWIVLALATSRLKTCQQELTKMESASASSRRRSGDTLAKMKAMKPNKKIEAHERSEAASPKKESTPWRTRI